jgi:PKD repeat protein
MQGKLYSFICVIILLSLLFSPLAGMPASASPGHTLFYSETGAINSAGSISHTYFSEDFSSEVFPPPGWAVFNLDGGEPSWERVIDDYVSGPASASHKFNVPPQIYQVGWLVTPSITLPEDETVLFNFYEKTQRPQRYHKQEVHISTGSCNPSGGDFSLLLEVIGDETWRLVEVDLTAYAGETVCVGFLYEGHQASRWLLDDVLVWTPVYDVSLEADETAKTGMPGDTVEYELTLTNLGTIDDTYELSYSSALWDVSLSETEIALVAGESALLTAFIEVPLAALAGEWDTFTVEAISQGDVLVTEQVELTTTAGAVYGLSLTADLTEQTGLPGETVVYNLTLTNTGNASDTFDLSYDGEVWDVSLSDTEAALAAGGDVQFTASVQIPLGALAGDWDAFSTQAVSQGDGTVSGQVALTTTAGAVFDLTLTADQAAKTGLPGDSIAFTLNLANLGNTTDTYNLSSAGAEWEVSLSQTEVELEAGESTVLTAQVTVPDDAGDGDEDSVLVTAASAGSPGQSADVLLTTTVVLTPLASFEASALFVKVGEEVTFTNTTTGSLPLTYQWDFGDGKTSTEAEPVHVYEEEGEFMVSLTAYNPYGESTFELEISAGYAPTAAFNASLEAAAVGEKVVFANASTGSDPIQYSWDFGDGVSSSAVNPEHTFTAPGLYTVSLLASNLYGEDEAAIEILVTPAAPVGADLEISLEVFPLPVRVNQATTIKATVFNYGPQTATGVSASGPVPESIEILAYSPACALEDDVLTCDLGEIEAGESKSAWITLIFTQAGTYEAVLGTAGLELDPDLENNLASTAILVEMNTLYLPLMQKP